MSVDIEIPITIDASGADVELFGSTFALTDIDYNLTNTGAVAAADLAAALLYKDTDSGSALFAYSSAGMTDLSAAVQDAMPETWALVEGEWATGEGNVSSDTLGRVFVQWIAYNLFGHPAAQAPISNDSAIEAQVHAVDYGNQFTAALTAGLSADSVGGSGGASNDVVKVIYEQMVKAAKSRFSDVDDSTLVQMPFQTGDSIKFIVSFSAINTFQTEAADTVGGVAETAALPDGLGTVPAVKLGLKITLA